MARFFRVRPSQMLSGSLDDYHIDMLIGVEALEAAAEARRSLERDQLTAGISDAVQVGVTLGG